MAAEKSDAIVLRVVDFSETSVVVTLFTRDFGKVSALAKGARRPKSPFEAALDVLSACRVVFLRKSGDSLHLLTEAKLERRFRAARSDLRRLYTAYYVIELLNRLTDELDPLPELYDLARESLNDLDTEVPSADGTKVEDDAAVISAESASLILLRFQMKALSQLGHAPSLSNCVECGRPVSGARVPFGLHAGGVFCADCRQGKQKIVSLSHAALLGLRHFAEGQGDWQSQREQGLPVGEMRGLADQYLTHLTGKPPRMMPFLKSLARTN